MEELANLFHGFAVALQPLNLMVMILGIVLGVIIGVLPGLGGANGVAILLPLTFSMSPTSAITMLPSLLWGRAVRGGHPTHPVQHPWGAMVGGDHLRRLSDGATGQGGRGAHRRLHLL